MVGCRHAAHAAEEILAGLGVRVEKKTLDPLDHGDFVVLCDRLRRDILKVVRPSEKRAMDEVLKDLDVDWASLSEVSRAQVIEVAKQRWLGLPAVVIGGLVALLSERIDSFVANFRQQAIRNFDLALPRDPSPDDIRQASSLVALQGLFATEEYQRQAERLGAQVARTVAEALAAGLAGTAVTQAVVEAVKGAQAARSDLYWSVMSTVVPGYSRSAVLLNAFDEAGIETYEFVSDLCAEVSYICSYMHGRRFSVARAVEQLRSAEAAGDPDSFKRAHPWVSQTKVDKLDILFYQNGHGREEIAEFDEGGAIVNGMDTSQLEDAGLMIPPLHGGCHSWITPVA